jgi:hypothetical protein
VGELLWVFFMVDCHLDPPKPSACGMVRQVSCAASPFWVKIRRLTAGLRVQSCGIELEALAWAGQYIQSSQAVTVMDHALYLAPARMMPGALHFWSSTVFATTVSLPR